MVTMEEALRLCWATPLKKVIFLIGGVNKKVLQFISTLKVLSNLRVLIIRL
jgi:hypothetical protein